MEYGLIGMPLGHSFSKQIHQQIGDYPYQLQELPPEELEPFFQKREFRGINVTIPYKEAVIPYLDVLSEEAQQIGAVNTVVQKDGKLYGYNTDFFGMEQMLAHANISVLGKQVLILGSGGTSKTAQALMQRLGAKEILVVSRTPGKHSISYEEAISRYCHADVILHTTPVGMFPNEQEIPIDLDPFSQLSGVVDVIYNPLRTRLVQEAKKRNIPACTGLFMLTAQAVRAAELFFGQSYASVSERAFEKTRSAMENIVLIGMPSSGKTTVGKLLAKQTGRPFYDSDEEILHEISGTIPDYFSQYGEASFRQLESKILAQLAKKRGVILATGGGAVLREENIRLLQQSGRLFFLDRPLHQLTPTADRPLSQTKSALKQQYETRLPLYQQAADVILSTGQTAEETAQSIWEMI